MTNIKPCIIHYCSKLSTEKRDALPELILTFSRIPCNSYSNMHSTYYEASLHVQCDLKLEHHVSLLKMIEVPRPLDAAKRTSSIQMDNLMKSYPDCAALRHSVHVKALLKVLITCQ